MIKSVLLDSKYDIIELYGGQPETPRKATLHEHC
jgi:hypothetical protein